jgi:enoyl-CoA hydratase
VPGGELLAAAKSMLGQMLANGPLALAHCIELVNRGADVALDQALAAEATAFGLLAATDDKREGTRAFLEKRAPSFTGA